MLNIFRMFSRMSGERVKTLSSGAEPLDAILESGVREQADVAAMASLDDGKLCVLAWHYHDDDVPGPDAAVELSIAGLPAGVDAARVEHYRVDHDHSNAFTVWKRMGSPAEPTAEQYVQLRQAGQLAEFTPPTTVPVGKGAATLNFVLPRQAVSLLVLTWSAAESK